MGRGNTVLLNASGGELAPEMYARLDLPAYQRGNERIQNYVVQPQGGLDYRTGMKHVRGTRGLATGQLVSFAFSETDTYMLEFTNTALRFDREFAAILNSTSATITGITKANPAVVTANAHGFTNGQEVYLTGIVGMVELNDQFFIVANVAANTFELKNVYGTNINSTNFTTYSSAGTARSVYEISTPYSEANIPDLHYTQSADVLRITSQRYPPFALTRIGHTTWFLTTASLTNQLTITNITQNNPGVWTTSKKHGYNIGDLLYVSGVGGMTEVNDQYWVVNSVPTTTTFTVKNTNGTALNTNTFTAYTSGGTIFTALERTGDPFELRRITTITAANPGVFSTSANHGFNEGDEVFVTEVGGMTQVNNTHYFINTVPTLDTFTLKDSGGTPIDTSAFTAHRTGGYVIKTDNCPRTAAFLDNSRIAYGNTKKNPAGLWFSQSPDSTTGLTKYDDFTVGTDATDAIFYTLAPLFNRQDAIQWISSVSRQIIVGCAASIRRVHGDTPDDPITPASIRATPISNVGADDIQPFSSGQSMFYVDGLGNRIQSFLFAIQSNDFVTTNQNLTASHLGSSNFIRVAQQRGDSGLLWVLRQDGILLGMTFNEFESIFGWHRHHLGGEATISSVVYPRAKVLSIAVEPRRGEESVLWVMVERTVGANTYRSVEYWTRKVRFAEVDDFYTEAGTDAQTANVRDYFNATSEQLKDSVHLDASMTYDGSTAGAAITMTPSATTGNAITLTAGAAFFTAAMVGREVWKKYDIRGGGGGRARITAFTNSTSVTAKVISDFDSTDAIAGGNWLLTTDKVYGLLHLVGEELTVQLDGAPDNPLTVAADGSLTLPSQSSKVHAGYRYLGLAKTLNLDVSGERGSAQAKIRRILEITPRFHNTVGAKIGTTPWNVERVSFKEVDSYITDRPTPLHSGIQFHRPSDSYVRNTKQVVLIQDIPSPQTLLSMDIMVDTGDD